ncbi:urease accessory protein UreD [Streptomyces sp. MST-110588]|uniref:urease accessory protein UreD n=1 Tax=Streptomyces sp. MST-110588 TaxID=2833628 RepID=UPI001F5C6884|nr:urease accessory protein UreD [Streptomyces sp. MST-110588]UNO38597.1 urease accessory protein UreD [Streptomyces sp. MST-110588]
MTLAPPGAPRPAVPDAGPAPDGSSPASIPAAPPASAAAPASAGGLRATARITARADADGVTRLPVLDGDGPLALRRIRSYDTYHSCASRDPHEGSGDGSRPHTHQARVCVVGAMSAPLGGDRLRIEVTVEPGADLRVTAAAATVALPGRAGGAAYYDVVLTVGEGARLEWLPEPLVSAAGSDLRMSTTVCLAPTARLVLREEQVLGRSGERPGRLRSRLTVRRAGRPLLDQETAYGDGVPGWDSAAVLGGNRATGQLLVAGPAPGEEPAEVRLLGEDGGQGVRTPLAGPAALVTAVAPDALRLRRLLDAGHAVR